MAITQYRDRNWISPLRELDQVASQLNRVFGDRLAGDGERVAWMPPVNVEETADELLLSAELPGLRMEDLDVEIENSVLTIRGRKEETRQESDSVDRRYHVWERRYGTFERSFTLPRTVSGDEIEATFDNGVLHIRMPKAPEAKGRKIEVRSQA